MLPLPGCGPRTVVPAMTWIPGFGGISPKCLIVQKLMNDLYTRKDRHVTVLFFLALKFFTPKTNPHSFFKN
jgi:hypothetical protein